MVIREILKTDTSSAAHTKLNQYHAKKEPPKIIAAKVEEPTIDIPSPGSLLSDPAKYEDFKKAIFGFSSGDDSLKRKSDDLGDDSIPQKKIKEDHENNKSDPKVQATLV